MTTRCWTWWKRSARSPTGVQATARSLRCSESSAARAPQSTCSSTKHLFLARVLAERFPDTAPRIVHRVYVLKRARARELFGAAVAATVPDDGLVDVHRYLTVKLGRDRVEIDATFPGPAWDGCSSLPLACDAGTDLPASDDPDTESGHLRSSIATQRSASPSSQRSPRADSDTRSRAPPPSDDETQNRPGDTTIFRNEKDDE
jgi:hypothetical protein